MINEAHDDARRVTPARAEWIARAAVGAVFIMNVWCAVAFIAWPERFAPSFEIGGEPGRAIVQAIGILFLMWNATYPPVVWRPRAYHVLFAVLLVQQTVGLVGETWLVLSLLPGHAALRATALRFILFDGVGLALMLLAYVVLQRSDAHRTGATRASRG
jgi:hypothetical protein